MVGSAAVTVFGACRDEPSLGGLDTGTDAETDQGSGSDAIDAPVGDPDDEEESGDSLEVDSNELVDDVPDIALVPPGVGSTCPPDCTLPCDIPTPIGADHPRSVYQSLPPRAVSTPPVDPADFPQIVCNLADGCPTWIAGWDVSAVLDFFTDGSVCCPDDAGRVLFAGGSEYYDIDWRSGATDVGTHRGAWNHMRQDGSLIQQLSGFVLGDFDGISPPSIEPCPHQIARIAANGVVEWIALYNYGTMRPDGGAVLDADAGTFSNVISDHRETGILGPHLVSIDVESGVELYRSPQLRFPPYGGMQTVLIEDRTIVVNYPFGAAVFDGEEMIEVDVQLTGDPSQGPWISDVAPPLRLTDGQVLLASDAGYQWLDTERMEISETDPWLWGVTGGADNTLSLAPVIHHDGSYYQVSAAGMTRYDRSLPVGSRIRVFPVGPSYRPPIIARDGVVIAVATRTVTAFAPGRDIRVLWQIDVEPGQHATGVLLDDGVLIFATDTGSLFALQTPHYGLARTPNPTWRADNQRSNMPPRPPYDTEPTQEALWRLPEPDEGSGEGSGEDTGDGSGEGGGA